MTSEGDSKGSFKVQDRRRFDAEGNERSAEVPPQPAEPAPGGRSPGVVASPVSGAPAGTQSATGRRIGGPPPGDEPIAFHSFIMSLATQALMQLGEAPAPDGVTIPVDTQAARQTIAILEMLYRRTEGNLSAQEEAIFEEILHTLRLSFVAKTR